MRPIETFFTVTNAAKAKADILSGKANPETFSDENYAFRVIKEEYVTVHYRQEKPEYSETIVNPPKAFNFELSAFKADFKNNSIVFTQGSSIFQIRNPPEEAFGNRNAALDAFKSSALYKFLYA